MTDYEGQCLEQKLYRIYDRFSPHSYAPRGAKLMLPVSLLWLSDRFVKVLNATKPATTPNTMLMTLVCTNGDKKLYLTGVAPCTAQTTPQTFQSSHEIFVDLERQQIGENGALKVLRVSEFQG